jgi:spermidine synthase
MSNRSSHLVRLLVLVCFFLSGATGLLYQVVWVRLFGFTLGNTHHSMTLVVAVFMGGLACGSSLGGWIADRARQPLRLYGLLILGVGVLCLAVPLLLKAVEPLFQWIYRSHDGNPEAANLLLVKTLVSALLLFLPTTLMGATLPVLSRHFTRSLRTVGWDFGRLYAVNTFGAAFGALFTGIIGIRVFGLWGSIWIAVLVDTAIAIGVFVLARGDEVVTEATAKSVARRGGTPEHATHAQDSARRSIGWRWRLPVFAFAVSGFANMMLELAWTKALVGTIGNSTYAFSVIVTVFILGIGLGGALMARIADRVRNIPAALGHLLLATGGVVLLIIPLLGLFPVWGAILYVRTNADFGAMLVRQIGMVALVLLPATTLMGMVFPLVGKWVTTDLDAVGRSIGNAYFANTAGSILGTLCAGFVLIPLLDRVYNVLYLAALLSLCSGIALVWLFSESRRERLIGTSVLALLAVFSSLTLPFGFLGSQNSTWHPAIHSLGMYRQLYAQIYARNDRKLPLNDFRREVAKKLINDNKILYFREGVHASVAVAEDPKTGIFALRISGKPEGSARRDGRKTNDMPHQLGAGHLPMLLHPGPREVLTLGLGSGVTLGALTLYSIDSRRAGTSPGAEGLYTVDSIDSLEISPEVLEAVQEHFSGVNHDATRHPRVRHVLGDGRNHLHFTERRFDVITSVPSNPWIAGIGNLFTKEFFEIVRAHLKPGGVFCQWIHNLDIREQEFRMVLRTVLSVFPEHLQLWDLGYDSLLIASDRELRFDPKRVEIALRDPLIGEELAILGIHEPVMLLRHFRWHAADLRRFVGDGAINTDLAPYLEFLAPLGLYGHHLDTLEQILKEPATAVDAVWRDCPEPARERVKLLRSGFHAFQRLLALHLQGAAQGVTPELLQALYSDIAKAKDSWTERLTAERSSVHALNLARQVVFLEKKPERAIAILEGVRSLYNESFDLIHFLALLQAQAGRLGDAMGNLDAALAVAENRTQVAMVRNDRGFAYESLGDLSKAVSEYRAAIEADASFPNARNNLDRIQRQSEP